MPCPFEVCPFGSRFRKFALDFVAAIFVKTAKKITTTKSSANFISPEPNGQGFDSGHCEGIFFTNA